MSVYDSKFNNVNIICTFSVNLIVVHTRKNKKVLLRNRKRRTVRNIACLLGIPPVMSRCMLPYRSDWVPPPPKGKDQEQKVRGARRKGSGTRGTETRGYPPPCEQTPVKTSYAIGNKRVCCCGPVRTECTSVTV